MSNCFVEKGAGWEKTKEGKSALCVCCRERNENELEGTMWLPNDLTAEKYERSNRYSTSTPREQGTQLETSQRSRQKTTLNPITSLASLLSHGQSCGTLPL